MSSTSGFSKRLPQDSRNSYKSKLHNTTVTSGLSNAGQQNSSTMIEEEKEEKRVYTINFSDDEIENAEAFQVDISIPLSYTVAQGMTLIVGVLNRVLKPYHCKLNPGAQYLLYQARKNGKPKSDLPSLANDSLLSETGVSSIYLTFQEKNEKSLVFTKKKNTHSNEIANQIYQNGLRKEITVVPPQSKEDLKGKRTFFMFCSCNY